LVHNDDNVDDIELYGMDESYECVTLRFHRGNYRRVMEDAFELLKGGLKDTAQT
jgi:hypothetical protein